MSPQDGQVKATELVAPILGVSATQALIDAIWNLEALDDITIPAKFANAQ